MAKADPKPHSPPIAIPNNARTMSNVVMLGANPEATSSTEYARIFHIRAGFRP